MNKTNLLTALIIFTKIIVIFPQTYSNSNYLENYFKTTSDSSLLNYFPTQKGNIWSYKYTDGYGYWRENMVSYGDTIMPNGLTYVSMYPAPYGPIRVKYYRIDTLLRIQEYDSSYVDTCGTIELNAFRLNEPDSSYWNTCINIGENLFWPVLRYLGETQIEAFNKIRDIKLFRQYYKFYDPSNGDSTEIYGGSFILMKGIGIYHTEFGEQSSATLDGAIINGVKYGNIVDVDDKNKNNPQSLMLYQNYPNPFNPSTIISFEISHLSNVSLIIYDVLGKEIYKLIDNREFNAGEYRAVWNGSLKNGNKAASGIYFYQLITNKQALSCSMILLK